MEGSKNVIIDNPNIKTLIRKKKNRVTGMCLCVLFVGGGGQIGILLIFCFQHPWIQANKTCNEQNGHLVTIQVHRNT